MYPQSNKAVFIIILQNIFHAVVEVPRWTNAKMEVYVHIFAGYLCINCILCPNTQLINISIYIYI